MDQSVTASFTADKDTASLEVVDSLIFNAVNDISFTVTLFMPRSWKDRLFSLPWRPWHNVAVHETTGMGISNFLDQASQVSFDMETGSTSLTTVRTQRM